MNPDSDKTGPLAGIKILDCTIWQNGPCATVMLSDLGAEVIKIEDRVTGDPGRGLIPTGSLTDVSGYFESVNRNKRSITLDLKTPEGLDVFYRLAAQSDIVVQNFRVGVVEKLKISYADLKPLNPKLIYASATGFGRKGPDAKMGVFDVLGQARSGAMVALKPPGGDHSYNNAFGLADQCGGMVLAQAITTALYWRERTGEGQEVEVSQLGAMMLLQQLGVTQWMLNRFVPDPKSRDVPRNPLFTTYECADNQWFAIGGMQSDRYWHDFCEILGVPEVAVDPRYATLMDRKTHAGELVVIFDKACAGFERKDLLKRLAAAGIPCAPVNTYEDLEYDEQVLANDYIVEIDHPSRGKIKAVDMPIRFSRTPAGPRTCAPEMGQDTETVLLELGLSWDEITELREKNVL
jgi:crotonobetainyl-CoA:carnitine CoA-transferase CaiB-like acyl-CoA transferase